MVGWNLGLALGRVPVMGISQLDRVTGLLGLAYSARRLEGPDPRTQVSTDQPVEGRHRTAAVKQGVVANDHRPAGIVTNDNLESPARCTPQELCD
jgi:hypothetical protein|tara:strand:- start:3668 stop:3952 length:285 start_codon:yes stop_codon:yes gene_type:complete